MKNFSKRINHQPFVLVIAVLASASMMCTGLGGTQDLEPLTATLNEIQGQVQTLKPEDGLFVDAFIGQQIEVNHQVLTHADGRARIDLSNGTIMRVGPLSVFTLDYMQNRPEGPLARLRLEVGEMWIILNGGSIEVDTASGFASVRGSYMSVKAEQHSKKTSVTCLEGHCQVGNGVGAVSLIAGQKADLEGLDMPPAPGLMNHADVEYWIINNPEATLVIPPLTATVGAMAGELPVLMSVTPTVVCNSPPDWTPVTIGPGENLNSVAKKHDSSAEEIAKGNCLDITVVLHNGDVLHVPPFNKAPSPTAVDCGPPADWVLYTVLDGETIDSVAYAFSTTVPDLQHANCLMDSTVIIAGQTLYVPNVPKVTATYTVTPKPTSVPAATKTQAPSTATLVATTVVPSATATLKPKPSATPTATSTATPKPTLTPTPTNTATMTPTATPDHSTTFSNVAGPVSGLITTCENLFSADVKDIDGISFVKVEFRVGDSNFALGSNYYHLVQNGNTWSSFLILDTSTAGVNVVYWRFWAIDGFGNYTYFPAIGAFSYTDTQDCVSLVPPFP
ncbi:MAG: LysM peptidoglycan-binding domain-containing protein [Anaerolineae bacterium]|nr:LysM peptidoglycan-binding domain-containing protein [Anaerolineae bacterium]